MEEETTNDLLVLMSRCHFAFYGIFPCLNRFIETCKLVHTKELILMITSVPSFF